jgi:hypothetical protein
LPRAQSLPGWRATAREAALRYFLDTEFNGFGGVLLSLALVREDGPSLYLIYESPPDLDPWVRRHIIPKLPTIPPGVQPQRVGQVSGARALAAFLDGDADPKVIADWPDDVRLFCQALMLGPGSTVPIDRLTFMILRVEPYPTDVEGAVEHNAVWDAMALRRRVMRREMESAGRAPTGPADTTP